MKVVYIAGPYRGPSAWAVEQNIRRAEELALHAWLAGFAVVCPHANTRYFQGAASDDLWLSGDLEIMRRCDAVLLVPGWEASKGTKAETEEAHRRGIPVFERLEDLRRWGGAP